ncbi:MAG TPA: ribonuclease R [Bdellovibrionales bacterium]|nr:ribonuclease R [Bdellovibrionales bacterium]
MKKSFKGGSGRDSKKPGKNSQDSKQGGGKQRKDIKNARSLADVLGGRAKSGPSKINTQQSQKGGPQRFDRGEMPQQSKGPVSKKLTYIMNFQEQDGNVRPVSKEPSRPTPRHSEPVTAIVGRPQPVERKPFDKPKDVRAARDTRRTGSKGGKTVQGLVKRHPDGFGFLICDDADTPDVYISRQSMNGIMTNDRIEVEIYKPRSFNKGKEDRLSGEVVRIVARSNSRVVGKFLPVDHKYGVLLDDGKGWGADLRIATKDSMDAKEGEMVAVEITQYPDHDREFTGRVVAILGDIEDPVNDVIRVVHQSGIPTEFSKEAIAVARKFGGKVTEQECRDREDLRELNLITIDGTTARDFDDAIFTEQTSNGFRLVVAIADVSHYVKPGTRLDEDAYERGTSTYFPNHVVPMLPEELSNELCSLKPDVERLCFACEMQIDYQGEILDYRFFEGVMLSKARVTYGEAQELMDAHAEGKAHSSGAARRLKHVEENILRSADLAKILMAKRFREGSLDLEIPETQVVVDSSGESVDVIRSQRLFAHRLIEELMLVTNICTARFLDDAKIPGIYRIHEEPDPDAIRSLQRYLWNLGGSRSVMGSNLAKKLTQALEAMKERPEAQILNILTLRTMQQAKYSGDNVGHFGLGFSHYSHFTSPIRRYPDLIAHRIIKSQLYQKYHSMELSETELDTATTWLSACEQRSVKAERKVISIKKARFMRRFIGQEFEGIISSVAKFGVFAMLRQFDVDGLVKIENLGSDRFVFDEENLRLIGQRTGIRYVIGDLIKVRVAGADPETGKVDFELAELPAGAAEGADDDMGEFLDGVERRYGPKTGKESGRGTRKDAHSGQGPQERKGRGGKKKRFNSEKRGKTEDDRRGVRKERFSKRRGKN